MIGKFWRTCSLLVVLLMVLAACGGAATPTEAPTTAAAPPTEAAQPTTAPTEAAQPTTAPTEAAQATEAPTEAATVAPTQASGASSSAYEDLARAEAGDFKGTTVSIFGVWLEQEETDFKDTLAAFSKRTGITIQYEGSKDFETLVTVRAEGGNAPDLAIFPQPGLLANLAREGKLVAVDSFMNADQLQKDYIPSWLDLATVDGKLYGVFFRASTKSLVWYPVKAFKEAGYTIPETWDDMIALSDKMVADGNTPWCLGLEQAGATGWYATDWIEDILLRTAGPEVYDQWVAHTIPFNDPAIKKAAELMGSVWLNPNYVQGGSTAILTTQVADIANPMFEGTKPGCWMYRQAGWASAFFPEGTKIGEDADFFYFPPIDAAQGKPVLGGGDVVGMFNDRPEVRAVIEYLATAESGEAWAKKGGFTSPNKNVPLDWYPEGADRRQAEILQQATVFRFDASDLMPAEVGTGSFWQGMVDYIGGENLDTVLQNIENSWPKK